MKNNSNSKIMAIIHVHGPFIFFYVFLIIFSVTSSNTDSEALLKLKQSFEHASGLDSWRPQTEPCILWIGVICENGVVFGLRLENLGLSGEIDIDALASISGLRSISLTSNTFSGPIPDFHRMGALRGLYITGNRFSGEIPSDYFSKMEGLKKVWLSGNKFSGPIPSSLVQLSQLMELHLENNEFSGTIPSLEQPSLILINVSYNNLEGEIPSGLSKFGPKAFEGNPRLCGGNLNKPCNGPWRKGGSSHATKISIWFAVAFVVVLLITVAAIFMLRRRQETLDVKTNDNNLDRPLTSSASSVGKKDSGSVKKAFGLGYRVGSSRKGSTRVGDLVLLNDEKGEFGLGDLMKAGAEVLGNGALGSSYKAIMASGFIVVVKRMKETSKMGKDQFDVEMKRFGSLNHKNVLTPLAYHYRKDEKLLVYEYQPKGSLLYLLHGDRGISHTNLTWQVRFKIIQGIARGLDYLHTELFSLDLPHGDLKSSNVLLTEEYEPLLVDYGFYSLIGCSQAAQTIMAYKSPEAIEHHQISPKCDVFCLGVIILEILTGKFPSQYLHNAKGGTNLVQWVRSAIDEGREVDLLDPDIASARNCLGDMQQLLRIGAACTESSPKERLDVREAIRRIEGVNADRSYQENA
ncbi:hypothetical protein BUALT_Bualt07G0167400 [Buddleja alternifolia]|uniref:Protein kinase domain-containing protein n=1 Tax=Buddleja alternifolia TaxID=168488 RepID=A0AAV6XHV9_9LAMI|nr:hypothetical protein BUALT_Bualt07G0167400 [Buddleja alternifolia]